MSRFSHFALESLTDQQVRFAPPERRREQVERAERLLAEIDPNRFYPYAFVCYKLTDFRPLEHVDVLVLGSLLANDLRLFAANLRESVANHLPSDAEDIFLTLEDLGEKFNVSTKTIGRWRTLGLIGQRILVSGRRQLLYRLSVVERFLHTHQDRVMRSARFSHLTEVEKDEILRRARRMAKYGGSLMEVCKRIARRMNRSTEAVRYTIRKHDEANPEQAVYAALVGKDEPVPKDLTHNHQGTPMVALATTYRAYSNSKSNARLPNEVHADKAVRPPVDYIGNETFDDATLEATFTGPMPGEEKFRADHRAMRAPRDVPPELASLYEWPLLTKEQEQHLFRKMNYLKHKLNKVQNAHNAAEPRMSELHTMSDLNRDIAAVKERLINCNMRLVASIAKKRAGLVDSLFELISDGNISLMRAVEKFDYSRGNKFSTYATWAIMKNFSRSIPDEKHHRERYVTGHDDLFEAKADVRTDEQEILMQAEMAKDRVSMLLDGLDDRTKEVIRMRNGLDGSAEMTLEQIGQRFGITKERVRQINVRGMKMLKEKAAVLSGD